MTREREINKVAQEYAFTTPSTIVESFEAGAKWADETMKNKIYEWLEKHARNYFDECDFYCFKCDKMIEGFKKAMEDDYE